MSKSLTFCQTAASDPNRSNLSDRDWSKAKEIDSEYFFEPYLGGVQSYNIMIQEGDCDEPKALHVDIEFDEDADFDYFVCSSLIHDGTLLFVTNAVSDCIMKVGLAQTYDSRKGPHKSHVKYTVGNFVVLNEYDKDFAPPDKPWMNERTTVLLPIKYENEKDDVQ